MARGKEDGPTAGVGVDSRGAPPVVTSPSSNTFGRLDFLNGDRDGLDPSLLRLVPESFRFLSSLQNKKSVR